MYFSKDKSKQRHANVSPFLSPFPEMNSPYLAPPTCTMHSHFSHSESCHSDNLFRDSEFPHCFIQLLPVNTILYFFKINKNTICFKLKFTSFFKHDA